MSKYIPQKGNKPSFKPFKAEWSSRAIDFSTIVAKEKEYVNPRKEDKERIESIPLDQVSYKDIYEFPLHMAKYGSWVYDAKGNFVFEFEFEGKGTKERIISILNGEESPKEVHELRDHNGYIQVLKEGEWYDLILIRGWGNLTGVGAYNLNEEYAVKIQDTFQDFIIKKLAGLE